jgi:hypothetical protein
MHLAGMNHDFVATDCNVICASCLEEHESAAK